MTSALLPPRRRSARVPFRLVLNAPACDERLSGSRRFAALGAIGAERSIASEGNAGRSGRW